MYGPYGPSRGRGQEPTTSTGPARRRACATQPCRFGTTARPNLLRSSAGNTPICLLRGAIDTPTRRPQESGTRQETFGVGQDSRLPFGSDFSAVRRKRPYDDHVHRDDDDGPHRVVGQPQEVRKRYQGRQDDTDDPSPQ